MTSVQTPAGTPVPAIHGTAGNFRYIPDGLEVWFFNLSFAWQAVLVIVLAIVAAAMVMAMFSAAPASSDPATRHPLPARQ